MKRMTEDSLLFPMNLQFFADEDGKGGDDNDGKGGDDDKGKDGDQNQNNNTGDNEKKFTQKELTDIAAREKKEGKNSVLKALGYKTQEEIKQALDEYNKYLESKKTEKEKDEESKKKTETEKNDALTRAEKAEQKLSVMLAGVNKESIDDALAIAVLKVTDEKSLDDVLEEMKGQKKYAGFFGEVEGNGNGGTGHDFNNQSGGKESKGSEYGKNLASSITGGRSKDGESSKKSYFRN